MKVPPKVDIRSMLATLLREEHAHTVTVIYAADGAVRLTRRGRHRKRALSHEFHLTVGRPNFETRRHIKRTNPPRWLYPITWIKYRRDRAGR
jgi:hypothetical protein